MTNWNDSVDFVIIGSGGGGFCAALTAHDLGAKVLLLEKEKMIGGSTAMSGGVLWIPNHPLGRGDSPEAALTYMNALVGQPQPGSTPEKRAAFLKEGPEMIKFLMKTGMKFIQDERPDYYDELPGGIRGASPNTRSLVTPLFDLRRLGPWQDKLRGGPIPLPIQGNEGRLMTLAGTTPRGMMVALRVFFRKYGMRFFGWKFAGLGAAMQGRMLEILLKTDVGIEIGAPVTDFIVEDGRVVGVVACRSGKEQRIQARKGVLIAAGGFARNQAMRDRWQPKPNSVAWSNSNPGETGEMIEAAMRIGAAVHNTHEAIWIASSLMPGRNKVPAVHSNDLAKPHIIVVDQRGERFFNEGVSYMEAGQRFYEHGSVPSWAVMDSVHRRKYPWGKVPPRLTPPNWVSSGYMKKADTLEELARLCGIEPDGLKRTVDRFNGFARSGRDLDFKRGERAYDRYWGDPANKPSPALGTIAEPPFYAVAIYPGDVGTYGGLVADEHARVLRADGSVIAGLYAAGNCTASVYGNFYPGAGGSIAASYVFGRVAAKHALGTTNV